MAKAKKRAARVPKAPITLMDVWQELEWWATYLNYLQPVTLQLKQASGPQPVQGGATRCTPCRLAEVRAAFTSMADGVADIIGPLPWPPVQPTAEVKKAVKKRAKKR